MRQYIKPLDSSPGLRAAHIDSVTRWARESLAAAATPSARFTLSVSEVSCSQPNCAPVETVISLLAAPFCEQSEQSPTPPFHNRNYSGKIFKPLLEVDREDVTGLIVSLFSGASVADHLAGAGEGYHNSRKKKKKSLFDLWAQDDSTHGEGRCTCCAPIQ